MKGDKYMKQLYFNRLTLLGESYTPVSLVLNVKDDFSLTKSVEEIDKYVQKVNEKSQPLYLKDIYITTINKVFDGYDETIKPNDNPIMILVQKTNEEGEKLYLEAIFEEETHEIVDHLETTRQYDEYGNVNEPIMEEVQKTSISGAPLYRVEIFHDEEGLVFDHVAEVTEPTDSPVLVPVYRTVIKDIFTEPQYFNIEEVLSASLTDFINGTSYDSIITDLFINLDYIDQEKTIANTGVGIMQLPVDGCLVTKSIKLEGKAKTFTLLDLSPIPEGASVYINTKKVVNNKVTLASPVSSITIKIVNNLENKPIDLNGYYLAYNMEVEI